VPYASLIAYERALATDAMAVSSVAEDAIRLADKVGDTALLETVFSANVGLDVDEATRSRMAYLAAREAHHQGNYGTALAILKMVRKTDPFYPESKALEGVLLSMQGRHLQALPALLTAQGSGQNAGKEQRFQDVLALNLARAYYGAGNYGRASESYVEVSRSSAYWSQAQLERAWAHFRMQDMNGALGLLHNHASPFFEDHYFPEAALLRVYSLFLMCKFPEATSQIEEFHVRYMPQKEAIGRVAKMTPAGAFQAMGDHVETGAASLPPQITRIYADEDRFRDSLTAVQRAQDETRRMANVSANPFTAWASDQVERRRASIVQNEGQRIVDRAATMEAQLAQMLTDAEMSKLDMLQLETRLYEQASHTGKLKDTRRTVSRAARMKAGYRHWPWEGEYWADEIGYYRIKTKPECPVGMAVGQPDP